MPGTNNIKNYPRLCITIGIILCLALVGGLIFVIFVKPTSDKFKLRKEYFNCPNFTTLANNSLVLKSCPDDFRIVQNELTNLYAKASANESSNTPSVCDGTSPSKSPTISRLPSQTTSPMASIMTSPLGSPQGSQRGSPQGSQRGSPQGSQRGSPLGSQKGSPRASQTNTSQTPDECTGDTCAPGMRYSATATPDEPFDVSDSTVFCPTSNPSVDNTQLYGPGEEFAINTLRTFQMRCSVRTNVVDGRGTITQTMVLLQKDMSGGVEVGDYIPKAKTIITDYVPGDLPEGAVPGSPTPSNLGPNNVDGLASVDLSDTSAMSHMSLVFSRWHDTAAQGSTYWMDGCNNTNWTGTSCRIDSSSNANGCAKQCKGSGSLSKLILMEYNAGEAPAAFGMPGAESRDSQNMGGYFIMSPTNSCTPSSTEPFRIRENAETCVNAYQQCYPGDTCCDMDDYGNAGFRCCWQNGDYYQCTNNKPCSTGPSNVPSIAPSVTPEMASQNITNLLSSGKYVIKTYLGIPGDGGQSGNDDTGGGISGLWQIAYKMKDEDTPKVRNFPVVSTYSATTVDYSEPICSTNATGSAIGTKLTFNNEGPRSYLLATPETGMTDRTYNAFMSNSTNDYNNALTFVDIAESYQFVDLRNVDMIFDVDMTSDGTTETGTGAGCDLALYWANMHWMAIDAPENQYGERGTPGACGDYYCDANANFSLCGTCSDRVNTKDNNYYFCTEMDILEGNMYGIHNTPHMCYEEGTPATYHGIYGNDIESAKMCTDPDNSYGYAVPTRWTGTKCDAFGFSAGNTGTGIVSSLIPYSSSNDVGCPQPTSDIPRVCGSAWTGLDWGTSANQH